MPRGKKSFPPQEPGHTVFDLFETTALLKTKREALALYEAGKLKVNGKRTHPDTPISSYSTRDFSIEADGQLRGIVVQGWG
jgi:hypothetical protein